MSTQPPAREKTLVNSGTTWEALAGYSRAVRYGDQIYVSGTTATDAAGQVVGAGDAAAQTRYIIEKIERALHQLGGTLADVLRTRIYVRYVDDWEPVARVHGEYFGQIRPANTLVQALLVGTDYLVEIEAEAMVGAGAAPSKEEHL
ncbi:MAG: RidA family protein [Caldilineaceae bacterium]|nr:RidA family protein [Caldilineaceae bacterium]